MYVWRDLRINPWAITSDKVQNPKFDPCGYGSGGS